MKYGRVNANFKEEGTSDYIAMDVHAVGFFSIPDWLNMLEQRLAEKVTRPSHWYLSYFCVMDMQSQPCGSEKHNHDTYKGGL